MSLSGINGSQPADNNEKRYGKQDLGIKSGSIEESIFNEIDKSDGKEEHSLSELQYFKFNMKVVLERSKEDEKNVLDEMERKIGARKKEIEEILKNINNKAKETDK